MADASFCYIDKKMNKINCLVKTEKKAGVFCIQMLDLIGKNVLK